MPLPFFRRQVEKKQTIVILNLQTIINVIEDTYVSIMWGVWNRILSLQFCHQLLPFVFCLSLICYCMLVPITGSFIIWTMCIICTGSHLSEKLQTSLKKEWCLHFNCSSLLWLLLQSLYWNSSQSGHHWPSIYYLLDISFQSLSSLISL